MAKKTTRQKLNKLVDKRTKLRNKKKKLEERKKEGKTTLFGNLRKKRITKKLEKNRKKINDPNTPEGRMALNDLKNYKNREKEGTANPKTTKKPRTTKMRVKKKITKNDLFPQ